LIIDKRISAEEAFTVRLEFFVVLFRLAGFLLVMVFITGFTDASIYNNRGIEMAVVGIGAQNEHSTDERIAVADMEKAVAVLVEALRIAAG
jgi:acetylornithine deacetylase/succinyl-diaminopimelate desuccinylase-like protein